LPDPSEHIDLAGDLWRAFPHTYAERCSIDEPWVPYNYLKRISYEIASMVANGGGKLIVEVPPRHGKSTLISKWVPIWFLDLFPKKKIILATYAAEFSSTWGRQVRNEIQQNSNISVKVASDSSASNRWNTTEGGGMVTAGIGGPVTGKGGHLIIIDDPVKNWDEANSAVYRQRNIDWMKSTMRTRAEPGAVIVVLQTRWHQQDLAGKLQEGDFGYKVLRFPAIAEEDDELGREVGEALCPDRYSVDVLEDIRNDLGEKFFAALFQQRPSPEEGEIFKRLWWRYYDEVPDGLEKMIQSWDPSRKEKKNSAYCVGQVWGKKGANIYLIDQFREKMGYRKSKKAMQTLNEKWPECQEKLVEDAANGTPLIDDLKDEIGGIIAVQPKGSKIARAEAISCFIEAGNVWLPNPKKHKWVEAFIEECCTFPNSDYKDQVDSMTQAISRLRPKKKSKAVAPFSMTKASNWQG